MSKAEVLRTHALPIKERLARIREDEMHEQPGGGRFSATGLADDPKRLALEELEVDSVDSANDGVPAAEEIFAHREVLHEAAHGQQRLGRPSAVDLREGEGGAHVFTSMAERRPSEKRLKEIDVMKITKPGRAATQGCTYMAVRSVFSISPHSGSGGRTPSPRKDSPEARIIETEIRLVA
jgi:hypothetical protein